MSCEPIEDSTVSNTSPPKEQHTQETTDQKKQTQLKDRRSCYCTQRNGITNTWGQHQNHRKLKVVKVTNINSLQKVAGCV